MHGGCPDVSLLARDKNNCGVNHDVSSNTVTTPLVGYEAIRIAGRLVALLRDVLAIQAVTRNHLNPRTLGSQTIRATALTGSYKD